MPSLSEALNAMNPGDREGALACCCGSSAWVEGMLSSAPFGDDEQVLAAATRVWSRLSREDWLEALAAHPRIGDVDSLRAKYAASKDWAEGEQSGVAGASDEVLQRLAEQNAAYEARFGHLFIICATGKSAAEMLAALEARLPSDPETELANAAAEQLKITQLRLRKLVE